MLDILRVGTVKKGDLAMQPIQSPARLIWISLLVAWCFDFFFWEKAPGISFFLFVVLCVTAGLLLAWREKRRPALTSWLLLLPLLFFSAMFFLRLEGFTRFLDVVFSLGLLALLAHTLIGGRWPAYSLADYLVGALKLIGDGLTQGVSVLRQARQKAQASRASRGAAPGSHPAGAVFRGIAITIPVIGVLAALLASADPVFEQGLRGLLNVFHLERLGEYILRAAYILIIAYVLMGIYAHALSGRQDEKLLGVEKPWLRAFLGFTETTILLASVDLLFAIFVGIQFRYFFGGQENIHLAGYTYAEYARRGFSELVIVAVISLLLVLGASAISRRENVRQSRSFLGLVVLLVGLVLVILVSAVQRLLLYEAAYGFTSLRTYTHIFIPWLGALLVATVVLEILRRPRLFAGAALLAVLGFGITLNVINVDAFIVRQNLQRTVAGKPLDSAYLASLSGDAVPALVQQFHDTRLPSEARDLVGTALACRLKSGIDLHRDPAWQAYHLSAARAMTVLEAVKPELVRYTTLVNADESACFSDGGM